MKNLQLFALSRQAVNLSTEDAKHFAFVNNWVYVLRGKVITEYQDRDVPGEEVMTITSRADTVIQFEYLAQEKLLWIGAESGFICVNLVDKLLKKIKLVSDSDSEAEFPLVFDSAEWSPTNEAFAAATPGGEIGVYGVSFENEYMVEIGKCNLHDDLLRETELGWGSAERQFRSSKETTLMLTYKGEDPMLEEDCTAKISWRANGQMFAVNYYINGIRKIRVYEYPCSILYESENIVGLQSVIAWRPSSNWIAGVVWTTKRNQLTIFEKNCLIRCNFELARKAYVEQLKWSPSGEVLAVQQSATEDSYSTIDLYCFNNYTMQLKQRLQFQEVNPLVNFEFLKSPDSLCVLRATTIYEAVTYSFTFTHYCSPTYKQAKSICISIDGSNALVTCCKDGMRPPPLSEFKADVSSPINFVVFHPTKEKVAFIDCCNVLTVFSVTADGLRKIRSFQLEGEPGFIAPLKFHQFTWVISSRILCVGEQLDPFANKVHVFLFDMDLETREWKFYTNNLDLAKGFNYRGFMEYHQNMLVRPSTSLWTENVPSFSPTAVSLTHLHVKSVLVDKKPYVFSLSSTNDFFVNDIEILQGVISFLVYNKYVFLTLKEEKLIGVRLNERALEDFMKTNLQGVYARQVEQGASLICGIPKSSFVAMQMPRGNIEMCNCRIITIDRIEMLLKDKAWVKALDMIRIEKLNMNVLMDLNFNRFIANIGAFIEAIQLPSVLSEFLLALEDNNIFNGVYRNCSIGAHKDVPMKRQLVCDQMIWNMRQKDYVHYINTLITACFVKKSATSISDALDYVRRLLESVDTDPSLINPAVEAFKSARNIIPSKDIFEGALATYDLDLVLFIARNVEMDPLEYEPFIAELRSVDPCRCRFKINNFLNRHIEAFQYLLRCAINDFEVLDYVKEHKISQKALWYIRPHTVLHVEVSRIVGTNLISENKYEEASVIFYRAKLYEDTLDAYKLSLDWKRARDIMYEMDLPMGTVIETLRFMAGELKKAGKIKEACQIHERYLDDYDTAIVICIEEKLFARAIKLAKKYHRYDILETDILEGIYEYCSILNDKFKTMLEDFVKFKSRLVVVRKTKKTSFENQSNVEFFGQPEHVTEIASVIGSTIGSVRTTSSRTSSRSRRKQERKKHSMREGSVYEDIALIESLYNLISEAFEWGPKVRELCILVLEYKGPHKPRRDIISLYNGLSELQKEMQTSIQEIWPSNMNNIDGEAGDIAVFKNLNIMDSKYRIPPGNTSISWKLETFPTVYIGD